MAKVPFSKFGLKQNQEVCTVEFNGQTIEVKQYLPVNTRLEMISNVINLSADNNNFANPIKIDIYATIEIIENYTNITFTDKQKEDITKLYDLIVGNDLDKEVFGAIPEDELNSFFTGLDECVNAVYAYNNSVLGIVNAISQDYDNLNLDATVIQEKLSNQENLDLVRQVLAKLG